MNGGPRFRDSYRAASKTFGKFCCLVAFLIFIGPILFLVGVGFVVASRTDFRAPKIAAYNQAVRDWNSTHLSPFSMQKVDFQVSGLNRTSMELVYLLRSLKDYARQGEFIASYESAPVFRFNNAFQIPRAQFGNRLVAVSLFVNSSGTVSEVTNSFNTFLTKRNDQSVSCSDSERERYGSTGCRRRNCQNRNTAYEWDSSSDRCYHHVVAGTVCAPIDVSSGVVIISGTCHKHYESTFVDMQDDLSFDSSMLPGNIPLLVRSKYDPDVILSAITGGSFSFGRTQADNRRDGVIMMAVGGVVTALIIGGVVLAVRGLSGLFDFNQNRKKVAQVTPPPELPTTTAENLPTSFPAELPTASEPGLISTPYNAKEFDTKKETEFGPPPAYTS